MVEPHLVCLISLFSYRASLPDVGALLVDQVVVIVSTLAELYPFDQDVEIDLSGQYNRRRRLSRFRSRRPAPDVCRGSSDYSR